MAVGERGVPITPATISNIPTVISTPPPAIPNRASPTRLRAWFSTPLPSPVSKASYR